MSDVMPNPALTRQRLIMDIAKLKATVERQRFEQFEMEDRRLKNEENIARSLEAIEEYETKLREFNAAQSGDNVNG